MNCYLSVVVVSRNDDHGGDPLRRTQIFLNSLAYQAKKYKLPLEMLFVEWNPPDEKPKIRDVLDFPLNPWFYSRIITVPPELHAGFRHGDRQPLFQMIGKNVGIRRAVGEFILTTNIDIILDDTLFECIAQKNLDNYCMYRADRYDISNTIPENDHAMQQNYCRTIKNHVRRNHRFNSGRYKILQEKDPFDSKFLLAKSKIFNWIEIKKEPFAMAVLKPNVSPGLLNCNACGDFTLMHRDAWTNIRGYGEFEAWSLHIDSIGCIQAYLAGYTEISFLPPLVCYHIEHAPASGWTPENGHLLQERIQKNGIPLLDFNIMTDPATIIQTFAA
ncbi:MAG: hypothetical protein LBQ88_06625 [Treponema sp.]|jgi:hypothetical protein|nr:hypothetical protein [Treponema sp.]